MKSRLALLAFAGALALPALAQDSPKSSPRADVRSNEGRAVVLRWPESNRPLTGRQMRRYAALPTLDTFQVGYRFAPPVGETVGLDLAVRWVPGGTGILRGRRVPYAQMPEGLQLIAFVVEADVMADEPGRGRRKVATFTYSVDSTRLAARDVFNQRLSAPLGQVFDGLNAQQARRVFAQGFTLERLRLTRAVFTVPAAAMPKSAAKGSAGADDGYGKERVARREAARDAWLTVYAVDRAFDIAAYAAWMYDVYDRYEEDDRRGELLAYALGAAGAVGAVGMWGGAAGVYGTGDTPLGLAGGYVRERGGLVAHASANSAALGMRGGVERVDVRLVGYRRIGTFPVMPMIGTGVRVTDRSRAEFVDPDRDRSRWLVSVGAAHNVGSAVLLGGVELGSGAPEVGVLWRWNR